MFLRVIARFLVPLNFLALFSIGVIVALHVLNDVPYSDLTRDPIQLLNGNMYHGLLSNVGMVVWSFSLGYSFFMIVLLKNIPGTRNEKSLFVMAFLLTGILLLDDMFMLHDVYFTYYLHTKEFYLYSFYALFAIGFLVVNWRYILKNNLMMLIAAFGFLGFSVFIDVINKYVFIPEEYLVEDGLKFLGITNWAVYLFDTGYNIIMKRISSNSTV